MSAPLVRVRNAIVALVVLLVALPVRAQEPHPERLSVPWGVGERLEYDLKFGKVRVGSGSMEVADVQDMRGREVWHTKFEVSGGMFVYRVNDTYESWFDTHTGNSLRFRQDLNEGSRDVERIFNMYPERGVFTENADTTAMPSVQNPLDDGSFLYFIRTIPLTVGETYSFDRYFRPDRNPVVLTGLRREAVDVEAGVFPTTVVRPTIKTNGIFSEHGEAQIWFSEDAHRYPVLLKSKFSKFSLTLELKSVVPGESPVDAAPPGQ